MNTLTNRTSIQQYVWISVYCTVYWLIPHGTVPYICNRTVHPPKYGILVLLLGGNSVCFTWLYEGDPKLKTDGRGSDAQLPIEAVAVLLL